MIDKKDITMVVLASILTFIACIYIGTKESTPVIETSKNDTKNEVTVLATEVTTTEVVAETVQTETTAQPTTRIEVNEADINLMARVVMSESGNQPQAGKIAVAETIINRVLSDKFPDTVYEVIHQPSQYSTADNGEPTVECYEAVYKALMEQTYPSNMYFFRMYDYHDFGQPYKQIYDHYFSLGE